MMQDIVHVYAPHSKQPSQPKTFVFTVITPIIISFLFPTDNLNPILPSPHTRHVFRTDAFCAQHFSPFSVERQRERKKVKASFYCFFYFSPFISAAVESKTFSSCLFKTSREKTERRAREKQSIKKYYLPHKHSESPSGKEYQIMRRMVP